MAMLTANQQPAPHAFSIIFCIIKRNLNEMYRHRPVLETSVPLKFQTIFLASDRNSQFLAGSLSHFLFLVNVDDFFTPADEYRFDFSSSTEPKFVMDVIAVKSKDRNIIQPAHFAKETTPDSSSADTAGSIPAASTEPSDLSSSSSSSCKSTDMVKEKPNSTRIYDEEGFRRRAACICVKSEDENESEIYFSEVVHSESKAFYWCTYQLDLHECDKINSIGFLGL
ncbi:hypothetical protein RUM44_004723 [Polyplax serrata]|uniref:Uncharacterized protein n=1 Tax=Polyplax serrata TaxID=468196 RepID=A0ABR1B3Q2_POLSC